MGGAESNVADAFRLGRALAEAGRRAEAEQQFLRVLRMRPDHAGAMGFLGLGAYRRGDFQTSEGWLAKALEVTPEDALLHQNLGLVKRARGECAAALECLDWALALRPDLVMAHLHRGMTLVALGRDPEAAEALARVTALEPRLATRDGLQRAPAEVRDMIADLERARQRVFADHRRGRLAALAERFPGADLSRAREFLALLNDERPVQWSDPRQRPSWMFFPGLEPRPWFEREEFAWVDDLERAAPAIREELVGVLEDDAGELAPYVPGQPHMPRRWHELADSTDWSAYHLFKGGELQERHCRRCPCTLEALRALPLMQASGHAPEAFFSILRPGTVIPPHVGLANTKLAVHLALVIPEGCSITVGGESRGWEEGRALVFDDSFEHEACNAADSTRVVLITEVWNPQLSEVEREAVREMIDVNTSLHAHWDEVARETLARGDKPATTRP